MASLRRRLRTVLATAVEGEMVPLLSLWLLIGAIVLVGTDFTILARGTRLLFYAVLVGIWISIAPTEPLADGGNYAQFEFLMIVTGALVAGAGIEWVIAALSGTMHAIQALALIVLGSRLYVNSLSGSSLVNIVRWHNPTDRYVVYVPSVAALVLPVALHQGGVAGLFGYGLGTPEALFVLAAASVLLSAVTYLLIEYASGPIVERVMQRLA